MPFTPDPAPAAAIDASVRRWALAQHARSTCLVCGASATFAGLLLIGLGPQIPLPWLAAWLLLLAAVLGARLALARRQSQRQPGWQDDRWLTRYRALALAHGGAWGASVALLPAGAGTEAVLILGVLLCGLAFGALALTLHDLRGAVCFALPVFLALGLRALLLPAAMPRLALLAGAVVLMLFFVFALAARRVGRERRALAVSRTAEADQKRRMALLLEHTEQGFWFIDNAQRTTEVNPAMCRLLGLPREQLIGRSIFEFVDAAGVETLKEQVRMRAAGQAGSYRLTLRRSDGRPVDCWNNATPLFDAAGVKIGTVGMISDISAQIEVEREVERTGELLAQKSHVLEVTLDSLAQGVLGIDAEGRVNTYNRRFIELMELPDALLASRPTLLDLTRYQAQRGEFGAALSGLDETGRDGLQRYLAGDSGSLTPRYQRRRPNGTVLDVQTRFAEDGSMVRTYTDVTASVAAEQALRESEGRFRRLADAAPALIWLADADGTPVWFNQRWLDHTGRTLEEELAQSWTTRMHPDDYDGCRVAYAAALAAQRRYEFEFRLAGGADTASPVWIADTGIPRFTPFGDFDGYISYGWDITARKAAEAAILQARDKAERADRAKSEFLSRMSHELRTPMNAILGFGQLLASDAEHPLAPVQASRLQELLRGGRHLLSLINEVLDLSRIEAGALQLTLRPVPAAGLLQDCLRLVQPMAGQRGIRLLLQVPPAGAPLAALADPRRLEQVLLNLLSNAIKYNRAEGRVQLRLLDEATHLRIEIQDDGPGIAAELQPRLFQAFDRLGAETTGTEGTGIGLVLSKWLVELMDGEIGFDSRPGAGSTFWVRLQRTELHPTELASAEPAPVLPAARAIPGPAHGVRRQVLYIEDNPVNQVLMEGMLAQRPLLTLRMAALPEEGLAMAAEQPPDLVLLDIQLPGIDGYEVLRRLRAMPATAGVPVVAVSANAMQSDLDQAREAGFADYVTKPLDLPSLLATVDRVLEGPAAV